MVKQLFNRVVKAAEGAALGTGTTMTFEVMHGNYSLLPNNILQKIMHHKLSELGGISYSQEENEYAKTLHRTLLNPSAEVGDQENILTFQPKHGYGSTDVGDLSWLVPTAGARIATWVPGTSAHSWQAVAAGGTSIGLKGTKLAAQVLSKTAQEIFLNPEIVKKAKAELIENVGKNFKYEALLGDRKPPLDYRN
jgi:aminobenzoyl-glutamate utilization protein B